MTQRKKMVLGFAVFIALLAGAVFAYNALRDRVAPEVTIVEEPAEVDVDRTKAPDFTVLDAQGSPVKLSDLEGKPVVLNFWASWCPPCKAEMPEFDRVYAELGDDVSFMMVDMVDGQRETKEIGAQYVADQGYTFPVYYDTEQEAAYTYGIRSIPTTLFIDKDGYIVTGAQGQLNEKMLRYGISLIRGG